MRNYHKIRFLLPTIYSLTTILNELFYKSVVVFSSLLKIMIKWKEILFDKFKRLIPIGKDSLDFQKYLF